MMEAGTSTRRLPIHAAIAAACALPMASMAEAAELPGTLQVAYIDPATGSLIIQAVLAFLAAVAVTSRLYWSKIKGWLGMASVKQADDGDLAPGPSSESPPNDG